MRPNVARMRRVLTSAAIVALVSTLAGCGSSSPSGPSTTTTVIQQGTFTLVGVLTAQANGVPADAARSEFTTSVSGSLQAVVDWTSSANALGVGFYQGSCTFTLFYANACSQVAVQPATNTKPVRLTLSSAPAGLYTLIVLNAGNGGESGTYQITLTR